MIPGTSDVKYNNPSWGISWNTIQRANLAFATNQYVDYSSGNWEPGIGNLSTPYIVSDSYSMGWTDEANAVPTFWRAISSDDSELLMLINQLPEREGDHFTDIDAAKQWLELSNKYVLFPRPVVQLVALDAANYSGSGPWIDTIGSKQFNLIGGPSYEPANGGKIYFYAQTGQYAECSTSLPSLDQWTVEVWHYYTGSNTGGSPCIISEIYPGTNNSINYTIGDNTGGFSAGLFDRDGWVTSGNYTLTPNRWYHIVGTYDGSYLNLYLNGALAASNYYAGYPFSSGGGIRLMRRWDNPEYWGGYLAMVNIYSGAINQAKISQNWNANKSRFGL